MVHDPQSRGLDVLQLVLRLLVRRERDSAQEHQAGQLRPAASVILWRPGPRGLEAYLVRRGATQRFAPGFSAFPGGRRDPEDAAVPVAAPGGNDAGDVASDSIVVMRGTLQLPVLDDLIVWLKAE